MITGEGGEAKSTGAASSSLTLKSAWSASATLCSGLGRLVAGILIARLLGPDGAGRVAYLLWLSDTVATFANFGFQTTLTRFSADLRGQGKPHQAAFLARWVFLRSIALMLAGLGVLGTIALFSGDWRALHSAWMVLTVYYCLQGLNLLYQAFLAGCQRFALIARVNLASGLLLVAGVAVGTYAFGVPGAIGGYLAGVALPAFLSLSMVRTAPCDVDLKPSLRRQVWSYAFYTWLAAVISAFVWSRMEFFFLKHYWGAHEVAMFSVGLSLAALAQQSMIFFSGFLMPHFSELHGRHDMLTLKNQYARVTRLMAFILAPTCFLLAAVTPVLLPQIYGKSFSPAVAPAIVTIAFSVIGFASAGSSVLYAMERTRFIALAGLLGAVLSVMACFIVIPQAGAVGAAWSRGIVQFLMIVITVWYFLMRLHMAYPIKAIVQIASCAAFPSLAAYAVLRWQPNPVMIPILLLIGGGVYLILIHVLRVMPEEDYFALVRGAERFSSAAAGSFRYVATWKRQST
jgi:O-antigen/teichoic acid export membrane protein